ncbi:hypothetical protein Tco_0369460 [Tanacetum coccineum]
MAGDDTDIRPSYDTEPMAKLPYTTEYNVFANERQHYEQPESINDTYVVEKVDSNVIPDSPDMCDNDIQTDQNAEACDDERVALANLIANLKLNIDENKKIQKQLKKANASLTQELKECKSTLEVTNRTLGESNSTRDNCLIALQNKEIELEKYKTYLNHTTQYDTLEPYETSVVKKEHDELVNQSLLTKSSYEGLVKEKNHVIKDLKLKEENDIDKLITMEKQLKFLNEIVYKRNQSIQTIYMLAPKGSTYNGRPTFANPMYLKKAQSKKPCLYKIPYDKSDLANMFAPDREETLTLEQESRSKLNKDLVKPYGYTKQNSLYEIFKPPSHEYLDQLAYANEVRNKMWRKSFVKTKPHIVKNIGFLPTGKSISKSRQAYKVMTNNINHFKLICDQAWTKHAADKFCDPTPQDMTVLVKNCLMPLAIKTQNDSFKFVHELKQEMHAGLKYVESLEKEIDELESDKADFSNIYDLLLQERVSQDVMYLKAQLQDKNIAISEVKKLIEKMKVRKSSFAKPYDVNAPGPSRNHPKHESFQPLRGSIGSNDMKKDAQSHKTTKRYTPVEKKSDSKKHDRQIPIGHRFSPTKSSTMYVKTMPPRSGLTWKPMSRIFTQVGLKWIPIRKPVETCNNTNDNVLPLQKETCTRNIVIYANSSSLSAVMNGNPSKVNIKQLYGRYKRWCCSLIPVESDSLPHAHAQTTKTCYKHQDSRIKKAQVQRQRIPQTLIFKIFLKDIKIIKTKIVKGDC